MYQFSYVEVLDEAPKQRRHQEREALKTSVELLRIAEKAGPKSRESIEALQYLRSLWAVLIEDLGQEDNQLPEKLRAELISIGIWLMREAEKLRKGETEEFSGLIEISEIISEGLK